MVQKNSFLIPSDKCGVWLTKTIHTYTKLNFIAKTSQFLKVSIRVTNPNNWLRKKKKNKGLFVRSFFFIKKKNGIYFKSNSNNILLLKKRLTPRGKSVIGPINFNIKRKRAIASFIKII